MDTTSYITASEIGEYVYCQRAWWLRVQGLLSSNHAMRDGEIKHVTLSKWLNIYKKLLVVSIALIVIGSILTIIFLFFIQ